MDSFMIVIPSLNPDTKLIQLVESIRHTLTEIPIMIVNDGSNENFEPIFQKVAQYGCIIKKHEINRGKGAALKTAINYILSDYPSITSMVTIDSDGQHSVPDMMGCIKSANENPTALILGTRTFVKDIPLRSRFGNILTRNILRFATGINLEDTQTGLRIIPRSFMKPLLELKGDRFEYEMNMLMATKEHNVPIVMHPIDTIYIEDNASSHFRVIRDSFKIYSVFFKYLLSSAMSFFIDVLGYALIINLLSAISLGSIYFASFCARGISSIFNYYMNRELVFNKQSENSFIKYFLLVILQIALSSFLVFAFYQLFSSGETVMLKIIVDSLLFFLSYFVQKHFIFKE